MFLKHKWCISCTHIHRLSWKLPYNINMHNLFWTRMISSNLKKYKCPGSETPNFKFGAWSWFVMWSGYGRSTSSGNLLIKIHAITLCALLFFLVLTTVMAFYLLYQNHTSFHLWRLQNWAARIIFIVDRRHESSPLLKTLHWLSVKQRITYKLLLYVYKALNGLAPMYMWHD